MSGKNDNPEDEILEHNEYGPVIRNSEKAKQAFREAFLASDFTAVDKLLSMLNEIYAADITSEQILEAVEKNVK